MDVKKIVENIQRLCKERGTTPTVAGRESGAGKDLVSNMKRKGTQPSIEKIRLLADYLDVDINDILSETKKPTVQDDGLSEAEQALMEQFRQLTPEQQDMVIRMVQAAADKQ